MLPAVSLVSWGCVLLTAAASLVAAADGGEIWAVLVAGSNSWGNYRHQADVCHAYQILRRHGVPDSRIIVMMYDDIAHNDQNKYPGKIFNKPNGTDVYKNVPKDYTKKEVNPKNFINILLGNSKAMRGIGSGKVLKSGPNDHVFINFVDHGAPGLVCFVDNKVLYADKLVRTLKTMHDKNMFKKLVFYLEACESGSMFQHFLPTNIDVFATTASNPRQSSYACYWDDALQTCLGDEYSVAWMEDIDSEENHRNLTTETLLKQFKNVVKRVTQSRPCMWGEKALKTDHVTDYLGADKGVAATGEDFGGFGETVSSRDVDVFTLSRRIVSSQDEYQQNILEQSKEKLLKERQEVDDIFTRFLAKSRSLHSRDLKSIEKDRQELTPDLMPCYKTLVDTFKATCVDLNKNPYALGHLYKFVNLCSAGLDAKDMLQIMVSECKDIHGM